jgi:hypothetical protein
VDTPAHERWCCNERHGEEEEVADAMGAIKEDAAGIVTVAAEWEDENNEIRKRTMWDNKSWGHQSTMGGGSTRLGGRQ